MNIENEIFKKSAIEEEKIKKYGFINENNQLIYKKSIMNNNFTAILKYDNNTIIGKIIDNETSLEYTNYKIENNIGSYASKVKEEYIKILNDIKEKCTVNKDFLYNQANRISKLIKEKYDVSPEFLWEETPNCGVFRNKKSNKWFGIIMNINKSKLNIKESKEIEIINVKTDELTNKLIDKVSIYEAYHMNKKKWVSITLDETLDDNKILNLIDLSYKSVNK